jgi:RNA polymerase sigma-70 factor (ECF subfamily)
MHERVDRLSGTPVAIDEDLEREFEARVADSSTLAFRVAFSVLRHREDAEDVAQDAFARAHRDFRQLRDRERFRAWLVRLTWRLALDHRRGDRRRQSREHVHHLAAPTPAATAAADSRADDLWRAIDALPEKLKVVIVLSAITGHDVRETAALLRIPEGTVKSRLFQARQQLKEQLS